ncbi:MAG: DNA polymerase IV [Candidatus Bathyarchaeota archaeon]|nr:DNA polymerase IV [Candidatus Bathyarchaeota archaeon]
MRLSVCEVIFLPPRVIMLVDLDYFFAQCEERRNPSLKEKPVVVCVYSGRTEDSGAVSTANYIAREYGVGSGISIFLAKKKLREADAVFLPVNHAYYGEISDGIMRILERYADSFEQVGIDEAYLDVTQRVQGSFEAAQELAQEIKEEVKARERLTCSVGVGPNKLVAKIAADFQKPDGLTVVKPENVERFLAPLPVSRLLGVGRKTSQKMESLGIKTIGDLAGFNVQRLIDAFGKNLGTYFRNASLGLDETPVQERGAAESISRISTLKEDTRDLATILQKANQLSEEVHAKLVQRSLVFRSVGVQAVLTDMSVRSRSRTLESPTNNIGVLKKTVAELFERLLGATELEVRRAGVKISRFTGERTSQRHLANFIGMPRNELPLFGTE